MQQKLECRCPENPSSFMKASSAVCGPNDNIVIPRGSKKTDWEVELGVVVGAPAKYVSHADALSHVAGYCVINDVSERAFQLEGTGQWTKGKSADTFGPIGPWLVTVDEIADPQNLNLWLEKDGHRFQNGNTRTMVFGVAHLISYLSQYMSVHPGDIISTGTPPGVGMGQHPRFSSLTEAGFVSESRDSVNRTNLLLLRTTAVIPQLRLMARKREWWDRPYAKN